MESMEKLRSAIRNRELEHVKDLIGPTSLSQLEGYILLCESVENGNRDIVELLLQNGVIVNGHSDEEIYRKDTPLNIAIRKSDVEIVRMLLDRGALVNHISDLDRTPLYIAFHVGYFQSSIIFPNNTGHVDGQSVTAERQHRINEIVKLLIDKGATLGESYTQNESEEYTNFTVAIERGYLSVVEHILKSEANVNAVLDSNNGYTLLHIACEKGDNNCVLWLLRHGADANAKAKRNVTPLHVAAQRGKFEHAKTLLDYGANVDAEDENGETALNVATRVTFIIVDCILKYNPSLNNKSNMKSMCIALRRYNEFCGKNNTPQQVIIASLYRYGFTLTPEIVDDYELLHRAMAAGFPTIVTDFLNLVTDFEPVFQHRDEMFGYTLLDNACKFNAISTFEYLLDKGADMNVSTNWGLSPLSIAVDHDRKEIIEVLLNRGLGVNDDQWIGKTVLRMAVECCSLDTIKVILKYRPDINNGSNRRSVRAAVLSGRPKEIIQTLLDYGFSVEPDNETDHEFIEGAIKYQHFNVLEEILKQSCADIMTKFRQKRVCTPLHVAAEWRRPEKNIVELLLKYGVNINAVDGVRGQTPLTYLVNNIVYPVSSEFTIFKQPKRSGKEIATCEKQSLEFVEILLRCGADPNSRDKHGRTVLHYAASSPVAMEETVNLLLKYGAIVNPRCKAGKMPFFIAAENGNRGLEKVFQQHGGLRAFSFKRNDDRSFLSSVASRFGLREYFEIPLKLGADINAINGSDNRTILNYACYNSKRDLIPYLLDYGHDIKPDISLFLVGDDVDETIVKTLEEHLVKLKFAGFKKLNSVRVRCTKELARRCFGELKTMEKEKIDDTLVYFRDILTDDSTRLAAYAKNKHIVRYIESEDYKTKFPVYANVLKGCLWKGIAKRNLLEGGIKLFRYYCSNLPELPDVCIERIFKHMGDRYLRIFVRRNLHMFSINATGDVEEGDLLLDGVVQFDYGKTRRIYSEEDINGPNDTFYYSEGEENEEADCSIM